MDEYTSSQRFWGLVCPGSPDEVGRIRRWVRDVLHDYPCQDDAALIVTELGANAIVHTASGHAGGTLSVQLSVSDQRVTISVTDSGHTTRTPHIDQPADEDTHGRGLQLVTALATTVEILGNPDGHVVTAHLNHTKDPA
ncbi:ATP-binding protein [Streptomyces sp. HPF1205]|uniref:ATP-binding protein n=1 Tax=Streptomyces sp. HPF1205 TaxID=2873262 RepID=UPI001CEC6C72|nr:ATP-binding protein [Streptomyces sp. HPF1205]